MGASRIAIRPSHVRRQVAGPRAAYAFQLEGDPVGGGRHLVDALRVAAGKAEGQPVVRQARPVGAVVLAIHDDGSEREFRTRRAVVLAGGLVGYPRQVPIRE